MNGQPEEDKSKATSVTADKTKSAKTPDSKPGKKRDRTPRKEIKVYTIVIGTSCLVGCYRFRIHVTDGRQHFVILKLLYTCTIQ